MKTKTTKPHPASRHHDHPLQKKHASHAISLPAVPAFQLMKEPAEEDASKENTKGNEKENQISKTGAGISTEEQKTRTAATAAVENIFYQRKAITEPFKPIQKKENNTGLPDNLKTGIENFSGFSMDDVKVHYNSDKPAQLNALAYAQGTNIHVAPGQEKHLPHEAWHVVQQKQGRVKATMQMKGGVSINDDKGLEMEADVMGSKVLNASIQQARLNNTGTTEITNTQTSIVQRVIYKWLEEQRQWIKVGDKDSNGTFPLPDDGSNGIFFNDVTGVSGAELKDVSEDRSLANTSQIFRDLLEIIKKDDAVEESQISPSWKFEVIKNKDNEQKLKQLAQNITKVNQPEPQPGMYPKPKFGHSSEIGTFVIDDNINKKRLQTEPELLFADEKVREKAVKTLRGTDEIHTSYQGAILRQFIYEERRAILGLIQASEGSLAIFSLERGGSMIADLMEKLSNETMAQNIKIPKPSRKDVQDYLDLKGLNEAKEAPKMLETPANQKQVHMHKFITIIRKFIEAQGEDQIIISIAETAVGGGSVNSLLKSVSDLCGELKVQQPKKKVKFKILIARETIKNKNYRGTGIVKTNDPVNITSMGKEGVKSLSFETDNPNEIETYFSQTRYLISEDVDYQLQYTGGKNSDKPVIVFEGSGDNLVALSIEPAKTGDSARDIIIDLIGGAYDEVMNELFLI
jgi:hypothetical protein